MIRRNIAATGTTTLIMTCFQVISVPIFIKYWGIPLYGEWVALTALVSYFQMADVGLNTATGNSLSFAYAVGDHKRFSTLLTNNIAFVCLAFFSLFFCLILAAWAGAFVALLRPRILSANVINIGMLLLFFQVFLGTLNNLLTGVYRAFGHFARGVMIDNLIRAGEYTVLICAVIARLPILWLIAAGCCVKASGLVGKFLHVRKIGPVEIRRSSFSILELKAMFKPAFAFLSMPISNSIALQGPVLVANYLLGSRAVVAFTTMRTLANFGRSLIDILQRAIWPEISLAWGRSDLATVRRLHRKAIAASLGIATTICAGLSLWGSRIYHIWTGGKAQWMPLLFSLLLLGLVTNASWASSSTVLQSTNRHGRLASLLLGASVVSLLSALGILELTRNIALLPLAAIAGDLLIAVPVFRSCLNLTRDRWQMPVLARGAL